MKRRGNTLLRTAISMGVFLVGGWLQTDGYEARADEQTGDRPAANATERAPAEETGKERGANREKSAENREERGANREKSAENREEPGANREKSAENREEPGANREKSAENQGRVRNPYRLSDAQVAAWLVLQHQSEVQISKWAAERAESDRVRSFARVMAAKHGGMIARLNAVAFTDAVTGEEQPGEVLQELGERVDRRLDDEEARIELEGRDDQESRPAADRREARREDRQQLREQREDVRDVRQDVRQSRFDRQDDAAEESAERSDVREARRDLREDRAEARESRREQTAEERRENVRNFLRETMPFVRDNLPDILEIVGESVEATAEHDAASGWLEFQRQVARKHVESVKNQLGKQDGKNFDEAFMAYQIGAHVRLINTLEVAASYVTSDLGGTVDQMLSTTREHLAQAQKLMQQVEDPGAADQTR